MEDKVIETIMYIKLVSKKKQSIDRIKTHLLKIGDGNVWSIENLPNLVTVNDCLSDTLKKQNLMRILTCRLYVRIISIN